jgi:hypothetical protein
MVLQHAMLGVQRRLVLSWLCANDIAASLSFLVSEACGLAIHVSFHRPFVSRRVRQKCHASSPCLSTSTPTSCPKSLITHVMNHTLGSIFIKPDTHLNTIRTKKLCQIKPTHHTSPTFSFPFLLPSPRKLQRRKKKAFRSPRGMTLVNHFRQRGGKAVSARKKSSIAESFE